jgi:hypothetical protein
MAGETPVSLAAAIKASAERLGISPHDLATAISYETGGTFDPWKAGPTTQWGQHRGLIQWGEPQRKRYGVTQDMPVDAQLQAAERYLTDAGVKPGHGLLDIYSAINAGRVGLYNRSDANNGGAPGTVRDKVANQMHGHRLKAAMLLDGKLPEGVVMPRSATAAQAVAASGSALPGAAAAPNPALANPAFAGINSAMRPAGAAAAPLSLAPPDEASGGEADTAMLMALAQIAQGTQQNELKPVPLPPIEYPTPPGLKQARALARAMGRV